jgi:hypothetical protein
VTTHPVSRIQVCDICKQAKPGVRDDPDPETGQARGKLCGVCRVGIASFERHVGRMREAIRYLSL